MEKYNFIELNEDEFQSFIENHEQRHFMQTKYMNDYYKLKGKDTYILGVKSSEKVIAAGLIYLESTYKGYKKFDIYKGFVMDYEDEEL